MHFTRGYITRCATASNRSYKIKPAVTYVWMQKHLTFPRYHPMTPRRGIMIHQPLGGAQGWRAEMVSVEDGASTTLLWAKKNQSHVLQAFVNFRRVRRGFDMSGSGSRNFISLRGSTSRNDIFFRPTLVCESPILTPRIWLLDFIPQEANLFKIHRISIKSQYNLHQIIKSSNPIKFHEITINSPSLTINSFRIPWVSCISSLFPARTGIGREDPGKRDPSHASGAPGMWICGRTMEDWCIMVYLSGWYSKFVIIRHRFIRAWVIFFIYNLYIKIIKYAVTNQFLSGIIQV